VTLLGWAAALIAASIVATVRGLDIARLTYSGVSFEGGDQAARDAFRDLILTGEELRMLTPALVIAACLTLIAAVCVLAVRWERRPVPVAPIQEDEVADAPTAS
jgi:hypothetical protein